MLSLSLFSLKWNGVIIGIALHATADGHLLFCSLDYGHSFLPSVVVELSGLQKSIFCCNLL